MIVVDTQDHARALQELLTGCRKCPKSFSATRRLRLREMVGSNAHDLATAEGVLKAVENHKFTADEIEFLRKIYPEHYAKPYPSKWPLTTKMGLPIERAKDGSVGINPANVARAFIREGLLEKWQKWGTDGLTMGSAGIYPDDVERFLAGRINDD